MVDWAQSTNKLIVVVVVVVMPQWEAAAADIKVPSGENTELKRSPFKA